MGVLPPVEPVYLSYFSHAAVLSLKMIAKRRPSGTLRTAPGLVPIVAVILVILAARSAWGNDVDAYLGPCALVASSDGHTLYIANADAMQIAFLDVATEAVIASVELSRRPNDLALNTDGKRLYASCGGPDGTVVVIDVRSRKTISEIPAGHTPSGLSVTPDGKTLYVCNRFDDDVSVIDVANARQIARISTGREPIDAAITPDGATVVVVDHLAAGRSDTFYVTPKVTFIDTETLATESIVLPNGSIGIRQVCVSPDGRHAYVPHILANYQLIPSHVSGGWINQNVLSIIDMIEKKLLDTNPLDGLSVGAGNPWAVSCTDDGRSICIAHAGSRELSIIDRPGLLQKLSRRPYRSPAIGGSPYDPGILPDLQRRIALPSIGARAMTTVGSKAYVAGYFSDTLDVVELTLEASQPVRTIRLGPEPQLSIRRRGEMLFHDATICFEHWQSCSSCHPDGRADGLNWDLFNDGVGNPKNTKTMLLAHVTPPSMITGIRATAEGAVRSGIQNTLFTTFDEEDAVAIDRYLGSLRPVPSPRLMEGDLSPAARRGKLLFERPQVGCSRCHPAPLYTDMRIHDVKSKGAYDHLDRFDTPTLVEVWRTAPYLHDGSFAFVEELLTEGRHGNPDGRFDQLDDRQMDDLVEFVLSL